MSEVSTQTLHVVARELNNELNDARVALELFGEQQDQVEVLLAWMSPLSAEERDFVMQQAKQCCDFLKTHKGSKTATARTKATR